MLTLCSLILILADLVVDVLILDGFGVMIICGPAESVRPHALK